jgi:hypothetical protein
MTIVVIFGGILADTLMKKKILSRTVTRKIFNCGGKNENRFSFISEKDMVDINLEKNVTFYPVKAANKCQSSAQLHCML